MLPVDQSSSGIKSNALMRHLPISIHHIKGKRSDVRLPKWPVVIVKLKI
jgi:hypothetical protein